jgi:hypothetical protein
MPAAWSNLSTDFEADERMVDAADLGGLDNLSGTVCRSI